MKQIGVLLLAFSTFSLGQGTQPPPSQQKQPQQIIVRGSTLKISNTPTADDMYCSGFITTESIPQNRYVVGGWNSPDQAHFAGTTDSVYIYGGSGVKEGDRLHILRKVRDPNHYEFFAGQKAAIRELGQPYFERGYVRVIDVQKNIAIAIPELSCGDIVPGDLAIPLVEREKPVFRKVTLDRYAAPNGKTTGRIVMANEFDSHVGSLQKVYLNIGDDKGLKVGDYLRATRTYEYSYHDQEAGLSAKAKQLEETLKNPPRVSDIHLSEFPRRTLGDMIVLHVHPRSATAMIMTALEDVRVGDRVELMDVSGAPEASTTTTAAGPSNVPASTAPPSPPTITCSPSPASVRVGDSSTISCDASSPDNRPLRIQFSTSGGKLSASGNRATLDTTQVNPGPINVRAVATDDRDLSASATATVNVEPPPSAPATAQKVNELQFKPGSVRVDNRSKAILDDVALKLQQDPASTAVLMGGTEGNELSKMGTQRAQNAANYLVQSKGIDSKRIVVKSGTQKSRSVEIWIVPAGASLP